MPIYEFYCADCHTIFSFLSRKTNPRKRPACPRCDRPRLERRPSTFAVSKGLAQPADGESLPDIDEAAMERAMEQLAERAESIDESNPRAMAGLMRQVYESSGLKLGEEMEQAIRRLEAGEDPDRIEQEMGDLFEDEGALFDPQAGGRLKRAGRRLLPPRVDPTLHEM